MQKRITKDLLTYLPGKALPGLAAFITVPIYTHLFSPDEFGISVLAVALADFLMMATTSGFCSGAVRFFSAYQRKANLSSYFTMIFGGTLAISLIVAAISSVLLILFKSMIPADLAPLLWAAIFLFIFTSWYDTLMNVLRGQERSGWYSLLSTIQAFGAIILGLILIVMIGMGVEGMIWGQALALLLTIIPLVWITTRGVAFGREQLNRVDLSQLWAFAWPVTIGNIALWSLRLSDRYFIEYFRGSYEVGLYSVGYKISARSVEILVLLFMLIPGPIIYRVWEEHGRQATEDALTSVTRMYFILVIPAVFGLAVIAAPLLRLLADEAYFEGYRAVWLVACASVGLGLSELASLGSLVAKRTRPIARNLLLVAGANLILNFLLVPPLGFMGAALSAALSFFLLAGFQALSSARNLTWRWPLRSLWKVLMASGIMSVVVLLFQASLPSDSTVWQIMNLLISILVGALIYGLALWIFGEIKLQNLMDIFKVNRRQFAADPVTDEAGPKG